MGKQGAESLHASFNYMEKAYNNMRDRAERLKEVLQNHHLRILPCNESLQPPPIKIQKNLTPIRDYYTFIDNKNVKNHTFVSLGKQTVNSTCLIATKRRVFGHVALS